MAHRARSARSDTSDADMDGLAERDLELQRLQRQLRLMDGDRKAYCFESGDAIKKQKREIRQQEKEREELLKDLRLIESRSNQNKDEFNIENLGELGREKHDVKSLISDEHKKQEELDAEIREWEKKIRNQHKNMGGVHMSGQHNVKVQKTVRKLENQLQLANNSFSKSLEKNKEMREEIDSLRVERRRFENLYKKLEKELSQLRQEIGEVIDQSTQAYDSREEAQAKMILLKEKADKDLQQHNTEMKELVRIIDHDRKLRDFMNDKSKERHEDPQLVQWRQRKEATEAERKKASQTDSVESYEAAFARIKEISGEEDLDLLVNHFIEVEDKNFALFNYVNEQNNVIEMHQEKIQDINDDIERFQKQGVELEVQRKSILATLEERQKSASSASEDNAHKFTGVMKIIDQLRAGVDSLFGKISCDRASIDDMLGAQAGITDQNMLQYLGIIEERTNHLLLIHYYILSQKDYEDFVKKQPSLLGEGPQAAATQPIIQPPVVGDEYDSDGSDASEDADTLPMTRGQLLQRAMKSVKKREAAAKKQGFQYDLSDARDKSKKKDKKK